MPVELHWRWVKNPSVFMCSGTPDITHQAQVKRAIQHLSTTAMFEMLETFTGYYNRLYTSETGVASQKWLFDEILDVRVFDSVQGFPFSDCRNTSYQIIRKAPPRVKLSL
jgi:hypothetical protein